jgi:hypothetical protein
MTRSQWTIVGIFGLSLAAAFFGFVWRYWETRQALEFWGTEAAQLIVGADQVEVLRLEPHDETDGGEVLKHGKESYLVVGRRDIAKAGGITHARNALTSDKSFLWKQPVADGPIWSFAIRFRDGERRATVLVDPAGQQVCLAGDSTIATINEKIAKAFNIFFREQFEPAEKEKSVKDTAKSNEKEK